MSNQKQCQDKYTLRLPSGMREQIRASAKSNHRSMNEELVLRIENSFERGEIVDIGSKIFHSHADLVEALEEVHSACVNCNGRDADVTVGNIDVLTGKTLRKVGAL